MKLKFSNLALALACSLASLHHQTVDGLGTTLAQCSCKGDEPSCQFVGARRDLEVLYDRADISATGEYFIEEVENRQRRTKAKGTPPPDPDEPCWCSESCGAGRKLFSSTEGECCAKSSKAPKAPGTKAPKARRRLGKNGGRKHVGDDTFPQTHAVEEPGYGEEEVDGGLPTGQGNAISSVVSESLPWIEPNAKTFEVELLSPNPGVWKIRNFLNDDKLEKIVDAVNRGGHDNDLYHRCVDATSHRHLDNKFCFCLSEESAISDEDSELVAALLDQMSNVWPTNNVKRDHFDVMLTRGGCTHSLLHFDMDDTTVGLNGTATTTTQANYATVTSIIYLSDGGAGTYFPNADLLVEPEKGAVLTWLNVNSDGSPKLTAQHGVQASAENDPDRLVLGYRTTFAKDEFPMLA